MKSVYLDHAAATPLLPESHAAMQRAYDEGFANTSGAHVWAQRSEHLLNSARETAAQLLGVLPKEIIFTSSGTESDNLALRGASFAARRLGGGNHILISAAEHPAVAETAKSLSRDFGFDVEIVPVDHTGRCSAAMVAERIRSTTILVSVILANNEVGSINPVIEIADLCLTHQIVFHSDAVQAAPWLSLNDVVAVSSLVSIGGQKLGGPGLGVLVVRQGTPIDPILTGGGQELGLRAGTPHVPAIMGLVEALRVCIEHRAERVEHVSTLRNQIISNVIGRLPDIELLGHPEHRTPNHVSLRVAGADANDLTRLLDLNGFACSAGAACKTGNPAPSSVLLAMGFSEEAAREGIRISLGPQNSFDEISEFLSVFPHVVEAARKRFSGGPKT